MKLIACRDGCGLSVCHTEWSKSEKLKCTINMYYIFIHSSVDEYLCCVHSLATVNSAAVKNGVNVSFWIMVFSGYMLSSGISGLYGIFIFIILSNCKIVFHLLWLFSLLFPLSIYYPFIKNYLYMLVYLSIHCAYFYTFYLKSWLLT